eukprot:TRINITY_DN4348_c0_g1_i4.p1 TRINITY_DN4348_c0_g1~~TRINITY_DN4348_c0_g1_i4.p1  ORF type:complete len:248 (-),score=70.35 TRINITY_DN4348_c0_g1_i4:151-894(-)
MSKLKVKANLDNVVKTVELERGNFTFEKIREQIAGKHGIPQFSLQFTGPTGSYVVSNDQQLQRAVKEAEKSQAKNLDFRVLKGYSAPSYTPAAAQPQAAAHPQTAARPAAAPAATHTTSPASPVQQRSAAPVGEPAPPGQIVAFSLAADQHSSAEKISVNPSQQADCFVFSAVPSKFPTDVVVVLEPGKKLTFQTTHSFEVKNPNGDVVVQTVRGAYGFELPFAPRQDQIQVVHSTSGAPTIKIFFR